MTEKQIQQLKPGDFLTWSNPDVRVGRIMRLEHFPKHVNKRFAGEILGAEVLVFPFWKSLGQYQQTTFIDLSELKEASFSTQIEIDVWLREGVKYLVEQQKQLALIENTVSRAVDVKRVLPMSEVAYDSNRNPPKSSNFLGWLWSRAKEYKLWEPGKKRRKQHESD